MDIILSIVGAVLTFVGGVVLYRIKRLDSKLDQHSAAIAVHSVAIAGLEKTSVTDGHVRSIVREEIQPLSVTVQGIEKDMKLVVGYIAEQRGYERAKIEAAERGRRSTD